MSRVLISYFSFSGKTKSLAEAAAEGAKSAGAEAIVKEVASTTAADFSGADAILIATPQTFGTMAAETKRLFERLWGQRETLARNKPFAAVITHATGPAPTVELLDKMGEYFGLRKVADSLAVPVAELDAYKERSRELGATLARST